MKTSSAALLSLFVALFVLCAALTREEATAKGVAYFAGLCTNQQAAFVPLLRAIELRDYSRAVASYVAARPFYEEIETLANSFQQIDADIDARPYVFLKGEDDPSFRGFHVIERLLYRDQDVGAALGPARVLKRSIDTLCATLADPSRFSPRKSWAGLLALAEEVPAKKISSEEETWSDLSIMIFRSNFRGIFSQYAPFTAVDGVSPKAAGAVNATYARIVKLIDEVDPVNGFAGRPNGRARPYSDVSIEYRRKILKLAYEFLDDLEVVRDEVFRGVPEPAGETEAEEVDTPIIADMYQAEVAEGIEYFAGLCKTQRKYAVALHEVLRMGNLSMAQDAYREARPPYEQIETLARDFEEEDTEIDARPYAIPGGESSGEFVGFHKVERALYRDFDLATAEAAMPRLLRAIDSLCGKLANPSRFTADSQFKGMLALAYEVPSKKISSEEETWSDLSIMIFRENAKGIYSQVQPYLKKLPGPLAKDVEEKFMDIKNMIVYDIDRDNAWDGTRFRLYSTVPVWQRKAINEKFYALARSLEEARKGLKQA